MLDNGNHAAPNRRSGFAPSYHQLRRLLAITKKHDTGATLRDNGAHGNAFVGPGDLIVELNSRQDEDDER